MLASLSGLKKRFFGGSTAPAATRRAPEAEWASLDLDPDLARFGAPEVAPAAAQPVDSVMEDAGATLAQAAAEVAPEDVTPEMAVELVCEVTPVAIQADAPAVEQVSAAEAVDLSIVIGDFGLFDMDASSEEDESDSVLGSGFTLPTPQTMALAAAPAEDALEARVSPEPQLPNPATSKRSPKAKRKVESKPAETVSARKRGPGISGAWRLPGMDGFNGFAADDSVETVKLELAV